MAFTIRVQKLREDRQRLVVKFNGIAGSIEDESNMIKLNSQTTVSSATCLGTSTTCPANGALQISKIWASVVSTTASATAGKVNLLWAGATTTDTSGLVASFGRGSHMINFNSDFGALVPDNSVTSLPGLLVTTTGFQAESAYTLVIELKKQGFLA